MACLTIVPVRLENCDRGDNRLSQFQQYDLLSVAAIAPQAEPVIQALSMALKDASEKVRITATRALETK